ncbi:helix-turn-helix domain-containing protein [Flavobacterium restrictum]|uniref:Helix-turn-helix domain-containing protein n=1 Tax=Flavobacterium restrictum TaxID=2594428 RepID=A0A553E6U3_9FLAO|nr:helix-turn-helix transcriptional regulator [Flavobacterium restrictum]TRX40764.1 helix-turn-helix domain-containing protein [Flavobacterium restrictum]
MIDRRKKHLIDTPSHYPHCGQLIQFYMKEHKITQTYLAKQLDVSPNTVRGYLTNPSIQLGILCKISQALHYNFVAIVGQQIGVSYTTPETAALQKLLEQKEALLKELEIKIGVYREIRM